MVLINNSIFEPTLFLSLSYRYVGILLYFLLCVIKIPIIPNLLKIKILKNKIIKLLLLSEPKLISLNNRSNKLQGLLTKLTCQIYMDIFVQIQDLFHQYVYLGFNIIVSYILIHGHVCLMRY